MFFANSMKLLVRWAGGASRHSIRAVITQNTVLPVGRTGSASPRQAKNSTYRSMAAAFFTAATAVSISSSVLYSPMESLHMAVMP